MLTLAYSYGAKAQFVCRLAIQVADLAQLTNSAIVKIIDLRSEGKNPFLLSPDGRRIRIPKRLRPTGIYNGSIPVTFSRSVSRTYKKIKQLFTLADTLPVPIAPDIPPAGEITPEDLRVLEPSKNKQVLLGLRSCDFPDTPGVFPE